MALVQTQSSRNPVGQKVRTAVFGAVLAAGLMVSLPARALTLCDCGGSTPLHLSEEAMRRLIQEELRARAACGAPEKPKTEPKPRTQDPKHPAPAGGCSANPRGK